MPSPTDLHPSTVRLLRALSEPGSGGSTEATAARQTWIESGYPDLPRSSPTNILGELLAAKRLESGMTQRDVAKALAGVRGATATALGHWESGHDIPDAGQLAALFRVLPFSEVERSEALRRAYDACMLLPAPPL